MRTTPEGCRNKGGEDRRGVPDMHAVSFRVVENTQKGLQFPNHWMSRLVGVASVYGTGCAGDSVWERRGGGQSGRTAKRNGVARQTRVSLSHPRVDICPGIVRSRPYVCSLSGAPNSLVAGEIGEQTKTSALTPFTHSNIWQRGSMNRRDSLAVSIADFVPRKSIVFAVTPAKNRNLLKSSAIRGI